MTQEELNKIIERHQHWINEDCEGWEDMKANFSFVDLKGLDLSYTNLYGADFMFANLEGANLKGAILTNANLKGALIKGTELERNFKMTQEELNQVIERHQHWINQDCKDWQYMRANLNGKDLRGLRFINSNLKHASLMYANLKEIDFYNANLSGVDFTGAILEKTNLSYANLEGANFRIANLSEAIFEETKLEGTSFIGSNLYKATFLKTNLNNVKIKSANLFKVDLKETENIPFIPYACPETGSFIGYKKVRENHIVEIQILEDSKRLSGTTRKCRCNKAKVLRILNYDRTVADVTEGASIKDKNFIYKVGEIVSVNKFDENRWNECGKGIHFFISFQEAVNYDLTVTRV